MPTLEEVTVKAVAEWRRDGANSATLHYYTSRAATSAGFAPAVVFFNAQRIIIRSPDDERETL